MTDQDRDKQAAALAALAEVQPGMLVGLGTGSTAAFFIRALARQGPRVACVATSEASAALARSLGLAVHDFADVARVDLVVDGADEIDDRLCAIKGAGGAMLREKIVAQAAERMIVIADGTKHVARIGTARIPVEVLPFALASVRAQLDDLDPIPRLRGGAVPYRTDSGNLILDGQLPADRDPSALAARLDGIAGVLGHGLFLHEVDAAYIAHAGDVRRLERLA